MITALQEKAHQQLSRQLQDCLVKYNEVEGHQKTLIRLRRRVFFTLIFLSAMLLGLGAFIWPFWSVSYVWGGAFLGVLWVFMGSTLHRLGPIWNSALKDWEQGHERTVNGYLEALNIAPFIPEASSSARGMQNMLLTFAVATILVVSVWLTGWKVQQWGFHDLSYLIGVACGCLMLALCIALAEKTYRWQTFTQLIQPLHQAWYFQAQELLGIHSRLEGNFRTNKEEQADAQALLKQLKRQQWLGWGVTTLLALPLAYLGSLALAQIAGLGYSYVGGLRFNALLWVFFTLMILVAEHSLKQGFTLRGLGHYSMTQLLMGWRLEQRGHYQGYRFVSWNELIAQKHQATGYLLLGLLLLTTDAVANYWYFVHQTGTPWYAALLVALMLPAVVVFLAIKLSQQQQQMDLVKQFLALNTERPLPVVQPQYNPLLK